MLIGSPDIFSNIDNSCPTSKPVSGNASTESQRDLSSSIREIVLSLWLGIVEGSPSSSNITPDRSSSVLFRTLSEFTTAGLTTATQYSSSATANSSSAASSSSEFTKATETSISTTTSSAPSFKTSKITFDFARSSSTSSALTV